MPSLHLQRMSIDLNYRELVCKQGKGILIISWMKRMRTLEISSHFTTYNMVSRLSLMK